MGHCIVAGTVRTGSGIVGTDSANAAIEITRMDRPVHIAGMAFHIGKSPALTGVHPSNGPLPFWLFQDLLHYDHTFLAFLNLQ